jgi:predicted Zn-dependent peptidase
MKKEMKTIKEKARKIESVTAKDIQRIANKIFITKNINLAVIGPLNDKTKLFKILSF